MTTIELSVLIVEFIQQRGGNCSEEDIKAMIAKIYTIGSPDISYARAANIVLATN